MSGRPGLRGGPALWRRLPQRVRHAVVTLGLVAASTVDALLNFPPPRDWTFTVSIVSAVSLLFWRRFPRLVLLVVLPGLYAGTAVLAAMAALYSVARTRRPHWEVYLGAGLVVQAPQSGDVVRITTMTSVAPGLFGATRPLS